MRDRPKQTAPSCSGAVRIARRVRFEVWTGNGSGEVRQSAAFSRTLLEPFPEPHAEQLERVRRVNAWEAGRWAAGGAERLGMFRGVRVWRSSPRRAADAWGAEAGPGFSRLRFRSGVLTGAADFGKVSAEGKDCRDCGNTLGAFLEQLPSGFRNRVRSSSPRWRGTACHARRKRSAALLLGQVPAGLAERVLSRLRGVASRPPSRSAQVRRALGGMTPERYAAAHVHFWREALRPRPEAEPLPPLIPLPPITHPAPRSPEFRRDMAAELLRQFARRLRELLRIDRGAARRVFCALSRLRSEAAAAGRYSAAVLLEQFRAFLLEQLEPLGEAPEVPPPAELLALPPSAPMAPPLGTLAA